MLYSSSMRELESLSSCSRLLVSLADNAHAMGKQLGLAWSHRRDTTSDETKSKETPPPLQPPQPQPPSNEEDDQEDYFCIFHMFYYKVNTFFSEVVYSLEPNENHKANEVIS